MKISGRVRTVTGLGFIPPWSINVGFFVGPSMTGGGNGPFPFRHYDGSSTGKLNGFTGCSSDRSAPGTFGIEEGFADAGGVMIYYKMIGKRDPLVILHGGPGASHDYFLPYLLPQSGHMTFIDQPALFLREVGCRELLKYSCDPIGRSAAFG
jgi:hypothetical protein